MARTAELMLFEELTADWTHLFELNTRPQLDAGNAPVEEDVVGRCKGKCTQRCLNMFNDAKLELEQLETCDDKCDKINIMIGEVDEIDCAHPAPSLQHYDAAIKKVFRAKLKLLNTFLLTKTGIHNALTPGGRW